MKKELSAWEERIWSRYQRFAEKVGSQELQPRLGTPGPSATAKRIAATLTLAATWEEFSLNQLAQMTDPGVAAVTQAILRAPKEQD